MPGIRPSGWLHAWLAHSQACSHSRTCNIVLPPGVASPALPCCPKASRCTHPLAPAQPQEAIATVGDNNYPSGLATTIQANIGKYYGAYIKDDPAVNKFWPCPGNHVRGCA
jgi:hypothetical protein